MSDEAAVEEKHIPEPRIEQMPGGVFRAADVEVYLVPVVGSITTYQFTGI